MLLGHLSSLAINAAVSNIIYQQIVRSNHGNITQLTWGIKIRLTSLKTINWAGFPFVREINSAFARHLFPK
jgi:hypothetical protein